MIKKIKKTIIVIEKTRYEVWCGAKGCNEVLMRDVGMPYSETKSFESQVKAKDAANANGWYATYRHLEVHAVEDEDLQEPSFVRCPKCLNKHLKRMMLAEGDDKMEMAK